jgi:tetratricopeptide (TPR) repeat protein
MHRLEWQEADHSFRRAIELDASYPAAKYFHGLLLVATDRRAEAAAQAEAALAVDPASPIVIHGAGTIFYYARDYDRARALFAAALQLDPRHRWSHVRLGLIEERRGNLPGAVKLIEGTAPLRAAFAMARGGREAEARRVVADTLAARGPVDTYHLATAYAGLGDTRAALRALRQALDARMHDVIYLNVDPRFDELRSHPEFQELLARGGWR